jgi:hypothetical protein
MDSSTSLVRIYRGWCFRPSGGCHRFCLPLTATWLVLLRSSILTCFVSVTYPNVLAPRIPRLVERIQQVSLSLGPLRLPIVGKLRTQGLNDWQRGTGRKKWFVKSLFPITNPYTIRDTGPEDAGDFNLERVMEDLLEKRSENYSDFPDYWSARNGSFTRGCWVSLHLVVCLLKSHAQGFTWITSRMFMKWLRGMIYLLPSSIEMFTCSKLPYTYDICLFVKELRLISTQPNPCRNGLPLGGFIRKSNYQLSIPPTGNMLNDGNLRVGSTTHEYVSTSRWVFLSGSSVIYIFTQDWWHRAAFNGV